MGEKIIVFGLGVIVTTVAGWFCECFLKRSVTAPLPLSGQVIQGTGGGKQLGTLERLLFYLSFGFDAHTIAAGWLAFKVAAKWAAWQHLVKLPDNNIELRERSTLSSYVLGRFLNGTLYNGLCAFIGLAVAQLTRHWFSQVVPNWLLFLLAVIAIALPTILIFLALFQNWPHLCEDGDAG